MLLHGFNLIKHGVRGGAEASADVPLRRRRPARVVRALSAMRE